jgi:hypothetical protein
MGYLMGWSRGIWLMADASSVMGEMSKLKAESSKLKAESRGDKVHG